MRKSFEVGAETRDDQGKGASRRLRRTGKVPAILYGGQGEPSNITLDQLKLLNVIEDEKFYSSIITLKLDGNDQQAIVKDIQLHPAKNQVLHVDLQRVLADQPIRIHLPIHFLNETTCPGVKNAPPREISGQNSFTCISGRTLRCASTRPVSSARVTRRWRFRPASTPGR